MVIRMFCAAIGGASGYAGGEILRLLAGHPAIQVTTVTAAANAGQLLGTLHPHLFPFTDRVLHNTTAAELAEHDVVFLALPHGASSDLVRQLPADTVVIDCGADYRLRDPQAWTQFYGTAHAGTWPYGLPELPLKDEGSARVQLAGARRIAIPGCYPTAVSLALAPGFRAGLLQPDVVVVAASGTSGAGRSLQPHLLASQVMGSMSPYGVGGTHRHTPEMEQNLAAAAGRPVTVSFTPTLAPMPRGILATATASLADGLELTSETAHELWQATYAGEPFVVVLPPGQWPTTGDVLGSNVIQLQVTVDQRARRLLAVAAVDNLVKGTAGAAIQCANLALGLPEATGLPVVGVAP